ncbi:hypothetical protein [Scytonema sp. HK-05]|uniref:hypothetical protein n=1 Tax=Scytonema sp. HK-05 TaxID=1137095 RepID=UPI0011614872|nr:hypothetical protein [Scytonema sp. HK-05]
MSGHYITKILFFAIYCLGHLAGVDPKPGVRNAFPTARSRRLFVALYGSGLVPVQVPKHYFPSLQAWLRFTEGVLTPTPLKHIGLPSGASNMLLPIYETTRRLLPTG